MTPSPRERHIRRIAELLVEMDDARVCRALRMLEYFELAHLRTAVELVAGATAAALEMLLIDRDGQ